MRKLGIFLAVLILALSVSAVFGQATETTYPQPSEYGPAILNWGPNVKYGGTFTFLNTAPYSYSLNPFFPSTGLPTYGFIYEPLMYMSPNGDITYFLATSYKWINSTTLEMTIRKNVKWTDGVPFTAKDVAFTFNYVKEHPSIDTNAVWAPTNNLKSVEATNDEVIFSFLKPSYSSLPVIASQQIVPEHIWSKIADPSKDTNLNPIGTGPFIFQSFNQANQVAVYVKNPNYWMKGRPYIDKFVAKGTFGGNQATLLALLKGEGDVAQMYIPDVEVAYLSKNPNNKLWWPVMGNNYLITNDTEYPFSIPEFRKALSLAMNRQFIVMSDYGKDLQDYENPTMIPLPQTSWIDPVLTPLASSLITYDPQKAQELLASIGFKKNKSGLLMDPQGNVLPPYTIKVVAGWTDWITGAQILCNEFKDIGLRVTVDQESFGAFYSDLQNGRFDMTVVGYYATTPNPYAMYFSALSSYQTAPIGKPAIGNFCRYTNPLIDDALEVFNNNSDPRIQKQAIWTIERIVLDDMPIIPFLPGPFWYEYQTRTLEGFPNAEHPYTYVLASSESIIALNVHLK